MSWAWRSFYGRPHALLRSSLRPVRRHGSQLTTSFGRNNLIGPRGYASNSSGDCNSKVNRQDATRKRHLYVVLDDHKVGFGVHKLDLYDGSDHDLDGGTQRLPDPPVLRVSRTTLRKHVQFAAVGSNIVAIGDTMISPELKERWIPDIGGVLIYDTKTAVLTVTAHLPTGLQSGYNAAMAVGNSLYMISSESPQPPMYWCDDWDYGGGSLHCLTTGPLDPVGSEGDKFWGWEHLSRESSPWFWTNFESPPMIPFLAEYITAHAVQALPGAEHHELFVSIRPTKTSVLGVAFSFRTATRKWTRRGEWHMPFVGHAHYDGNLDAWVGLHAVNLDGNLYGPRVTDGHLCAGNVTSAPTMWKVGKDKLFRLDEDVVAGWRHTDAKLVPMASGEGFSQYCLMECMRHDDDDDEEEEEEEEEEKVEEEVGVEEDEDGEEEGVKCLLRLTSFRVEPGQDGEPMVTTRRVARSYEVSCHSKDFNAQVFFI